MSLPFHGDKTELRLLGQTCLRSKGVYSSKRLRPVTFTSNEKFVQVGHPQWKEKERNVYLLDCDHAQHRERRIEIRFGEGNCSQFVSYVSNVS